MNDKRTFPRWRKRLLVELRTGGRTATGFTWDLSHTGLFVSSSYVPKLGEKLEALLTLPSGKKVACVGTVVRIRRVPTALADGEANHGFSLALGDYFEDYARFLNDLR
ncbi:MAG TPA: PilZ domain-containing protein [Thermoanaerobaculia bacterium]|nr:PilZ domain-containing protein [Thermoanaerobaculia bacterium]